MEFAEILTQVLDLLQRQGRVSYGALKRRFHLDDEYLQDLKDELIDAQRVARDEDGKVLVWVGASSVQSSEFKVPSSPQPPTPNPQLPEAERRQLTVMFCDLVGSTALSAQLDPEDFRTVIQAYREACAIAISRFGGYLAKYIGDGLLVYFGYPHAHDDDAARAVRTGLELVAAIQHLSFPTIQLPRPLQVRIGIHTGLVVAGEMGTEDQPEPLAILGETPNVAARLQEKANPNGIVISPSTYRLVQGLFECQDAGPQTLKGIATPLSVYQVVRESEAQSRFEVAVQTGLTPLVGRAHEMEFLRERWGKVEQGAGQVVLLSGEPGIGKSRLVQEFKAQLGQARVTRIEFRCSPYHQNSALYPIIDHLQRLLQFAREDSPVIKLEKLKHRLSHYHFPQAETFPLLASLLALPHPEGSPPLTGSPLKQKEKLQAALVAWLIEEAEKAAVYCTWEDLHWTDPSTLEVLHLIIDQAPTARLYVLLTFRPEFTPPWSNRSPLSQLTLSRLGRPEVEAMVEKVIGDKALPSEIVRQIVAKTDGVPLFIEELTKTVLESVESRGSIDSIGSAIPTTLQDSLMARLDRLGAAKEIAQLGATIGREFSYELLQAVSRLDEARLQQGLKQLVRAELVYQHGLVPQAHYLFKHALIQDMAYQSLLKSIRQQYHLQIAQVLETRLKETIETQPELLAHHYTEAGRIDRAIPYWQQAGIRAAERSANTETISHTRKGLALLQTLPSSDEHVQQELVLQMSLGLALMATKGYAAPEVAEVQARLQVLCQQVGETPLLFQALPQLRGFYFVRGELHTARTIAEQYWTFAQRFQIPVLLVWAAYGLGETLLFSGDIDSGRSYLEQGIAAYDREQVRTFSVRTVHDPGVANLSHSAIALWYLGYPTRAIERQHQALTLARELSHPFSIVWAFGTTASLYLLCREEHAVQEQAEAAMQLAQEQGFPFWIARAKAFRGWVLAQQGQGTEGVAQICHSIAACRDMGMELYRPHFLILLAEAYSQAEQATEGLKMLAEALEAIHKTGARLFEAEAYRLKGELTLQRLNVQGSKFKVEDSLGSSVQSLESEAEECFLKAIEVARRQQAKSLELRAATSLVRLWQQQGKHPEDHHMLSEIYGWFTEGFDTKDLQEAKALLEELSC